MKITNYDYSGDTSFYQEVSVGNGAYRVSNFNWGILIKNNGNNKYHALAWFLPSNDNCYVLYGGKQNESYQSYMNGYRNETITFSIDAETIYTYDIKDYEMVSSKYNNRGCYSHFDFIPSVEFDFQYNKNLGNSFSINMHIDLGGKPEYKDQQCNIYKSNIENKGDIGIIKNAHFYPTPTINETEDKSTPRADFNFNFHVKHLINNLYETRMNITSDNILAKTDSAYGKSYSYYADCDGWIQSYMFDYADNGGGEMGGHIQFNVGGKDSGKLTVPFDTICYYDHTLKLRPNLYWYFQGDEEKIFNNNFMFTLYEHTIGRCGGGACDIDSCHFEQSFAINKTNQLPTISDYDHDLGSKNSAFEINYTVWDEDNDKLSVTQRLNYTTIGTYSNVSSGTSSTIYITDDMLKKLPLNQKQYIYIIVDDGKGGQTTRTLSFTRINATPAISGYDMDLGDKNVGFNIDYSVSDADNDSITVTELLNGQIIRQIPNIQGNANETITISNEQLYKTPLNQQSTIVITANDGKDGVSKRTYTFTRTNTPVAIGIIKKTYPIISFRCTDSNPSGYVRLVEVYINNSRVQSYTSGFDRELKYNVDIRYLREGNNTLTIRATNNQNITSSKNLSVNKKSLPEPEIGGNIIVKGKRYQIINKKSDSDSVKLMLNKPLQNDISTTDRIELLNSYCNIYAKTDENNEFEEMQFIKSKDLGNGYTQERYQLDITGIKVTTRVILHGNTAIKQIKEAFQYLED